MRLLIPLLTSAAVLGSSACRHTVRLEPETYDAAYESSDEIAGMRWETVAIESADGTRRVLYAREATVDAFLTPTTRCLEFTRRTTGRVWAFGGIGFGIGAVGGLVAGAQLTKDSVGTVQSKTAGALMLAMAGGAVLGAVGGLVGHASAGPDDELPVDRCGDGPHLP